METQPGQGESLATAERAGQVQLPIAEARGALVAAIRQQGISLVVGETGSGKSTQLPQYVLEAGLAPLAVSQPRRVAAISIAQRVAYERGGQLGQEVSTRMGSACFGQHAFAASTVMSFSIT